MYILGATFIKCIRPTFWSASWANRKVRKGIPSQCDAKQVERFSREKLTNCSQEEIDHVIRMLHAIYESDISGIRGLESKAFGAITVTGLVFIGNQALVAFLLRNEIRPTVLPTILLICIVGSMIYFACALSAFLQAARPKELHILGNQDVLPKTVTVDKLVIFSQLNQPNSIILNNLIESVIFDTGRALVLTLMAFGFALI